MVTTQEKQVLDNNKSLLDLDHPHAKMFINLEHNILCYR